ncbi:FAD-dependent oxidoreductase [Nocardia sp. NPDC058058]|uniref:FAD-dependent oxidoreductase n=1 Tax=Nocardia sp. NPDC058058 TaxID=3346317 RepID=UPI0036DF7D14
MTYVITQNCCNDASCVAVCPVGCIHPTPDEPGFATAELLHIDPATCIDCGACADACPVDAIRPEATLTAATRPFARVNADYYRDHAPTPNFTRAQHPGELVTGATPLRVAVIGSGAAGLYSAAALLRHPGVKVDMFEKLSAPHGLIRHGVAPDHPATKRVIDQFDFTPAKRSRFQLHLGVAVGTDISHAELLTRHHAVIYACGAENHNQLGIPGAPLRGVHYANAFAGWYNNHPIHRDLSPDLSARRAVVIGNGNVALDIARILATDPARLTATDISDTALKALRHSNIEEIIILGRRAPEHASFTTPELLGLLERPDIDILIDPADLPHQPPTDPAARTRHDLLATAATTPPTPGNRRITLRFHTTPTHILGTEAVTAIRTERTTPTSPPTPDEITTTIVIPAIGFRGKQIPDLPFNPRTHTIPNTRGRVLTPTGTPLPGVYTAGWIKRGPTGVIGTNRTCAEETITSLLADHRAGLLAEPTSPRH